MISMREAYEKIGANYDDACARLMGEEMLARFALKFLDDESMDKLEAAMAAGDAEGAFMAAHTLKGVSQNLGFDNLYEPAVVVTEALRGALLCCAVRELTGLLNLCRCLDKRLPQVKVGLERHPRVLGMPLHAQAERLAFDFDALGNAVGCLGDQARAFTQTIDAAVVCGVGLD